MSLGLIVKALHVLSAIWFISGLIGRGVAFAQAARSTHIQTAYTLLKLSDFFEQRLVIPGSMAVLVFGLLVAWIQGWPLFGFLQGARANWLLVSLVLFLSPIPMIPLYLIPRRKLRARLAEEALARGELTPALTAAFQDRVVSRYRTVELVIAGLVTVLMITKPF
jgi:uncharacterized membrane protein